MKTLMIAALCVMCQISKAQTNLPPKKANKIIVLVKDSANTLLDKITVTLFDLGYTIENKDEKGKFIITQAKPSKNYGTMTRIRARINDSAIVFSGQVAINLTTDIFGMNEASKTFYDVDYSGQKKSANREAWNELDVLAHKFGNNIVYSK